jgi:hypothetical protein
LDFKFGITSFCFKENKNQHLFAINGLPRQSLRSFLAMTEEVGFYVIASDQWERGNPWKLLKNVMLS